MTKLSRRDFLKRAGWLGALWGVRPDKLIKAPEEAQVSSETESQSEPPYYSDSPYFMPGGVSVRYAPDLDNIMFGWTREKDS